MVPTFIVLTLTIGVLGIITIFLAGNIVFHGWKLHSYIKENYEVKLNSYKKSFSLFSSTKIARSINDQDEILIASTTKLEKRAKYFLFLFGFCFVAIVILTALGFILSAYDKF